MLAHQARPAIKKKLAFFALRVHLKPFGLNGDESF
jgi:hypothetical protein